MSVVASGHVTDRRFARTVYWIAAKGFTGDLIVSQDCQDCRVTWQAGAVIGSGEANVRTLFAKPLHPYTQGLIASIPILGTVKDRLEVIPGSVPNLVNLPPVAYVFTAGEPNGWLRAEVLERGLALELRTIDPTHKQNGERVELTWA